MLVALTGADTALGALLARELRGGYRLRLSGSGPPPADLEAAEYRCLDVREPEGAAGAVGDAGAVVHVARWGPLEEAELLDLAGRGTYTLLHAALRAGARRFVLVSDLSVVSGYPESLIVDETFRPRPAPTAAGLAPYLAELAVREFCRAEPLTGICLRAGPETAAGTTAAGVRRALDLPLDTHAHRWLVFHLDAAGLARRPTVGPALFAEG